VTISATELKRLFARSGNRCAQVYKLGRVAAKCLGRADPRSSCDPVARSEVHDGVGDVVEGARRGNGAESGPPYDISPGGFDLRLGGNATCEVLELSADPG
jgi:hypothetical protein